MYDIVVLSTVHHYQDARIFYKEIPSIKKVCNNLCFMVPVNKEKEFIENGVNIIPLRNPSTKFERIKLQITAWKKIKAIKPKIVHFHDPELIVLGYFLKKVLKIKVVFDIHENVSESFKDNLWIPSYLKPIIPKVYSKIENILIKDFDAVIIAEKSYRETYGERPIELLNYPISEGRDFKKKNFNEKLKMVYIGGIWERRGIFQMLRLFNKLEKEGFDLSLSLVGPFVPKELKQSVENFVSENKLKDKVVIYGRKTLTEVYDILEDCHLGLSLMKNIKNYNKSLSTKIFDYMLSSIPYVVSNFKIYSDYTINSETGIAVDYNDEEDMYLKVKALLNDKSKLSLMSNNGFCLVKEKWNWETQEKKLFALYKKLLDQE